MPTIKFHSGQLSLSDLRDECQALQEHDKTKLVHLQGAQVENAVNNQTKFNQAQYAGVAQFSLIPELTFIKVDDPGKIPSIVASQLAAGGMLIFDEILFVQGNEQRALGFGKV
ncbi:MAG TPA: hypothetical protein VJ842_18630 [Pyrinomonadaceae bacterium]|nr:hypothetical protein [Pyrinomonadaceae bacterium]